jgi:hypothetical protein
VKGELRYHRSIGFRNENPAAAPRKRVARNATITAGEYIFD